MHKDLPLWQFIEKCLKNEQPIMLMVVMESVGSSPGRKGFKMAVDTEGGMIGSIGGGIMEQKLVELAKDRLQKSDFTAFIKKQVHRKDPVVSKEFDTTGIRSGMICSGEQTILFKPLTAYDLKTVQKIILSLKKNTPSVTQGVMAQNPLILCLSPTLFSLSKIPQKEALYQEPLGFKMRLYIIGGGHCSLALSELMLKLGYYIHVFDDRQGLNTLDNNPFAHEKTIIDYEKIAHFIPDGNRHYIVIMTLGYRTDGQVIRHLIRKNVRYLGVLGSQTKANALIENLKKEGLTPDQLSKLHMPIGIKISSQTPMEIAISIAAEIIHLNNTQSSGNRLKV